MTQKHIQMKHNGPNGEVFDVFPTTKAQLVVDKNGKDLQEVIDNINNTSVSLGETSSTAYRGDRGKIAYDHSQVAHAPSNAQRNSDITKAEIEAKLTGAITSHTHNYSAPGHTHSSSEVSGLGTAAAKNVGTASGQVPVLDANGKLSDSVIPAVAITDTFVAASEAAMLALSVQVGDIAVRTDINKSFILQKTPANVIGNWIELKTPDQKVISVAGKTGAVTLVKGDVGLGNVDNTADSAKSVASAGKWTTARTLSLTGAVTGSASIDGSGNVSLPTILTSHNHDGVYTKPTGTIVTNRVAAFSDTTGRTIKDSGYTIAASVPADAKFTDTVYVHPNDANTRHVTDSDKNTWNAKASTAVATTSANGLMSSADKSKLDGVAANANNYSHPSTHPASVIVQDSSNRFVTDTEKNNWNSKATTSIATASVNGLMASADKSKLDGIATGANNYVHPNDVNTRHVTDAEKSTWNAKESTSGAQTKADKAKTDAVSLAKTYTDTKVAEFVGSAPETLDTLKELASALGNDPNFATTITNKLGTKAEKSYVDTELGKKANSSHGNHVPTVESANNTRFLRNDNTWQAVTPANIGALASGANAVSASKWATPRTLTLGGDLSGSVSIDGSANVTLNASIGNLNLDGVLSISKPVLTATTTKFAIGVTPNGELTTKSTTSATTGNLVLKAENGTKYLVSINESGNMSTASSSLTDSGQVYLQADEPYGTIFKLGVLNDGTLITSPICDVDLVDDEIISADRTWSSLQINERLSNLSVGAHVDSHMPGGEDEIPLATTAKHGLMPKEKMAEIDSIKNTMNTKMNNSRITISTSSPSGGNDGDIWIMYE